MQVAGIETLKDIIDEGGHLQPWERMQTELSESVKPTHVKLLANINLDKTQVTRGEKRYIYLYDSKATEGSLVWEWKVLCAQVRDTFLPRHTLGEHFNTFTVNHGMLTKAQRILPPQNVVLRRILVGLPKSLDIQGRQLTFIAEMVDTIAVTEYFT